MPCCDMPCWKRVSCWHLVCSLTQSAGFLWRGGKERMTTGIWMYGKPFVRTLAETGEKVGVILMDTQGEPPRGSLGIHGGLALSELGVCVVQGCSTCAPALSSLRRSSV